MAVPKPTRALRVGLTGNLGSGKSTVAALLAQHGALVLSSDEIGRQLMQPGTEVFRQIVERFGPSVQTPEGTLDRTALARLLFAEPSQLAAMNAIVHPAVIAEQEHLLREDAAGEHPHKIAVIESALLFETPHAGPSGWRSRFDTTVLVTAPEPLRLQRALARTLPPDATPAQREAAEADLRRRMAAQMSEAEKAKLAGRLIPNESGLPELERAVQVLWAQLLQQEEQHRHSAQVADHP